MLNEPFGGEMVKQMRNARTQTVDLGRAGDVPATRSPGRPGLPIGTRLFRCGLGLLLAVLFAAPAFSGFAQDVADEPFEEAATVEVIELTPKLVEGFIKARPQIMAVVMGAVENDEGVVAAPVLADPGSNSALEKVAATNGFRDFDHLMSVENTIGLYFTAIDPASGQVHDPRIQLEQQIREIRSDTTLDEEARNEIVAIYEDMLAHQPPLDNKTNIKLIQQYYQRIQAALTQ